MTTTTINKLKKGDFFKLTPNGRVYVRGEYNRMTRNYEYNDFDDANRWHECKGRKVVFIDLDDEDFD